MNKETNLYELLRLKIMRGDTTAIKLPSYGLTFYQSEGKKDTDFMLQKRAAYMLSWQIFKFIIEKNTVAYIKIGYNSYYWKLVVKLADVNQSLIYKIAQLPELSEKLGLTFIVAHDKVDSDYFLNENSRNLELTFQKQNEQGTLKANELIQKYFVQRNEDMVALFDHLEQIIKVANIDSTDVIFEPKLPRLPFGRRGTKNGEFPIFQSFDMKLKALTIINNYKNLNTNLDLKAYTADFLLSEYLLSHTLNCKGAENIKDAKLLIANAAYKENKWVESMINFVCHDPNNLIMLRKRLK